MMKEVKITDKFITPEPLSVDISATDLKITYLHNIYPNLFHFSEKIDDIECKTNINFMPEILGKTVQVIKTRYPVVSQNSITNVVLAKVAQAVTSKRVKYLEANKGDGGYPNYYAINFMPFSI